MDISFDSTHRGEEEEREEGRVKSEEEGTGCDVISRSSYSGSGA